MSDDSKVLVDNLFCSTAVTLLNHSFHCNCWCSITMLHYNNIARKMYGEGNPRGLHIVAFRLTDILCIVNSKL